MITGREQHIIAVFNSTVPLDNQPLIIPRKYDLTADLEKEDDFTVGQMDHVLPFVQSAFIDNGNAFPLWVYFPISDYTLKVGSNMQGVFPIYSPMPLKPRLTLKGGDGSVLINWCNFAQPFGQWTSV
jgi:hypothetical protein